jgi:dTDP-4-dehydrorhamnose reductase
MAAGIELWGGVEPTLNRVGDEYHCQLTRSGHDRRLADLDLIATLGVRKLRYPVLWERTQPRADAEPDWHWPDERLLLLRELGITPIIGLVHHGSGPPHTSLLDPRFPAQLAAYAERVAGRYPWVNHYTPVNEPLTTALFSGLYGVWYPHARSDKTFTTALLNECRAVALAMRAIRTIRPDAKLVQTDDLGKTYSTPALRYQAEFNNERRWLTWDLLSGKVDGTHALWDWLIRHGGASDAELMWFVEHPCPPDIIGVNHYVTSERYITEALDPYAPRYHGGNGTHRYADVEAARCIEGTGGIRSLLAEAWERYRMPLAVTEVHIDTTREDQLRWIVEVWRAAEDLRRSHADVRAVTLWALFGTFDWNSLVSECRGYYEPGAFDVRSSPPRATAVASLAKSLGGGTIPQHPVLTGPGWWKRPGRFFTTPVLGESAEARESRSTPAGTPPILITGASGTLGRAFARICEARGLVYRLLSRQALDIADASSVEAALEALAPWAVVNAAGYVRVDDAEHDGERCFRENTLGAEILAMACARHGVALATFSTDLVFDGSQREPYVESDTPAPLNVYGRTKYEAECRVLDRDPEALVVRTSAFFGPWDRYNYVTQAVQALRAHETFAAAYDVVISPTYVPDLVNVSLDLLIDRAAGIWHASNGEPLTWAELARRAAELAGVSTDTLEKCRSAELGLAANRPRYSALASARCRLMPPLEDALARYTATCGSVL